MDFPLPDGAWSGRRAIVVGGGPSLRGFDWSRLKDELWIGTNRAWVHNPTIHLVLDVRLQGELLTDKEWLRWPGLKVWHRVNLRDPVPPPLPPGVHEVGSPGRVWSRSLASGLAHGSCVAPSAINLADLLVGPKGTIYLLGFDLHGVDGQTANWHDDYPWRSGPATVYNRFRQNLESFAPHCQAKIFNVSLDGTSTLRAWPMLKDIPSVPPRRRPLVVSFATSSYFEHARSMEESARAWGLDVRVERLPDFPSWREACKYKPRMLAKLIDDSDRPILWVDSDARFRAYPELFDQEHDADVMAHVIRRRTGHEQTAAGTIWLNNTPGAKAFIHRWLAIMDARLTPDRLGDNEAFGAAFREWGTRARELPGTYCWIFDLHPELLPHDKPVIEHLQASRNTVKTASPKVPLREINETRTGSPVVGKGLGNRFVQSHQAFFIDTFGSPLVGTFNISLPEPFPRHGHALDTALGKFWLVRLSTVSSRESAIGWAYRSHSSRVPTTVLEVLTRETLPERFKRQRIRVEMLQRWGQAQITHWAREWGHKWFQDHDWLVPELKAHLTRPQADSGEVWRLMTEELARAGQAWSGKRVLDWGCAEGFFTCAAAKAGALAVGADISAHMLSIARDVSEHIEMTDARFECSDVVSGEWDLILSLSTWNDVDPTYERLAEHVADLRRRARVGSFLELVNPPLRGSMTQAEVDRIVSGKPLWHRKHPVRKSCSLYWVPS